MIGLDRELQQRSQDLSALVGQSRAPLASDSVGRFVESGESYAQLIGARRRVLDSTPPIGKTPLLTRSQLRAAVQRPYYSDRRSTPGLDEPSRFLATTVGSRVLVVGETRQNNTETLNSFREVLLLTGPAALLLAALVGYLLAGLSLRQVEAMRRRAASISAETPGRRLPVPPTGDEVERLGATLNQMLERLEVALERERGFVADAGHELRTPLALLRTELELALRQAETADELREAVRLSSQEAERLSQLAEDLLLIARTDRGGLPLRREDVDIGDLFIRVSSRFEWRAHEAGARIVADPARDLRVRGDPLRLEQALSNLLDNALRYGGETVRLTAVVRDDIVELHVEDDGPGFPADFLPRAFERFTRFDSPRGRGGAGLGLSIVRAIAGAHGGSAHVANRVTRGADAWLAFSL